MNTDKLGRPIISAPPRRLSPACRVRRKGISGTERRLRACSMAKTPCRRSRVNPPGCVLLRILTMCWIYVLLAAALFQGGDGPLIDMAVILAVAVVNALIGFAPRGESNAENRRRVSAICCPARRWRSVRATMKPSPPPRWYLAISWRIRDGDRIPADLTGD